MEAEANTSRLPTSAAADEVRQDAVVGTDNQKGAMP